MTDTIKAILPFFLIMGVLIWYVMRSRKHSQKILDSIEKQSEFMKLSNTIANENLDLMRRQVAALEEIAKKP
ncbi:MAG: hypothetical protein GQ535_10785 [Rhodobacteraceae bacterium]|nr:hypothetical protein [Paracoccaceae bacterium]